MIVCIPGSTTAPGGPNSFRARFGAWLVAAGFQVHYDFTDEPCDVVVLAGATRRLGWVARKKRQGALVIHRLDGINWRHLSLPPLSMYRWRASSRNALLFSTRDHLADVVVYQSEFVRDWWWRKRGASSVREEVIFNGVDVGDPPDLDGESSPRPLIVAEGNHESDRATIRTLLEVHRHAYRSGAVPSTQVFGRASPELERVLVREPGMDYRGQVGRDELLTSMRAGSALLSLDRNPACPNVLLEAMSVGLPVAAFDTGAVRELVSDQSGRVVPYGGDPWTMDTPTNIDELAAATSDLIAERGSAALAAYEECKERFSLDQMANLYVDLFEPIR